MNQDPRENALYEARIRNINSAVSVYWKNFQFEHELNIRIGIELKFVEDMEIMDGSNFSDFVDSIIKHVLQLKLVDKKIINDHIYNMISSVEYYSDRDITVELVNSSNQVLLTTFYFNNQPAKEN
jgi:hypothetical protein